MPSTERRGRQGFKCSVTDHRPIQNNGWIPLVKKFAKLHETEKYGQILVKLDSGDEGPETQFFFTPSEMLGVCSMAIKFEDTEEGWDKAEVTFETFSDEAKAIQAVAPTFEKMAEAFAL